MAITVDVTDGIRTLTIDRPPVNALDVDTLTELSDSLDDASGAGHAVVLTGRGATFSAGADLPKVLAGSDEYVDAGIDALTRCFRTLFLFPRPVVAAVNGHALAGGAVLTCACDYRIMGGAGRIGVIELAAGVPFPAWALEVVRHAVNNEHLQEVIYLARTYEPGEALRVGLLDEVTQGDVVGRALDVARSMLEVPAASFALTKKALRGPVARAADQWAAESDEEVKTAWRSPEVRAAVQRQMERLKRA